MSAVVAYDDADLPIVELFLSDARANGEILTTCLGRVIDGADPTPLLPELSVAAQSIKGAARIVLFEPAAVVAEELEATFHRVEDGDFPLSRTLAQALLVGAGLLADIACLNAADLRAWADAEQPRVRAALETVRSGAAGQGEQGKAAPLPQPSRKLASVRPAPPLSQTVDPEILALFHTEAEACSETLGRGLVELESGGVADLEGLMRAAHSIKGAARIVGIDVVTRLAHSMEECFVAAQEGRLTLTAGDVDELLRAVDVLSDVARCPPHGVGHWQGKNGRTVDELSNRLKAIAAGLAPRTRPPVPVPAKPDSLVPATPKELPTSAVVLAEGVAISAAAPAREQKLGMPQDRVVRVAAQSINRLMGLAGESLVESRRVQSLGSSMQRLKRRQTDLSDVLDAVGARSLTAFDAETTAVLADAKARALECRALLTEQIAELDSYARRVDDLSERLYREALKSRMRPFGDCVHGFPRMVRDLGRQLGKQVRLQVVGESTDVDRDVLESLEAPLNHLLRNGVDHGLEQPRERGACGKVEQGTIRLEARHHAGMLAITVSDDGRGIDPERVRAKIAERGLLAPDVARDLSVAELMEFIFLPGFSTAQGITEISGRGVGLDAVRSAVEAASGVVRVVSERGKGTTFHLQLPVTRSVMRAVVSEVSGEAYAFPLLRIERVLRVSKSCVNTLGRTHYFVLGDANVALVSAQQILGLGAAPPSADELCVVIVGDRHHRYGVTVDRFLGEHDLVVRPLDPRLGKVQDIAAAAILVSGSPALIFDVDDLVRSIEKLAQAGRVEKLAGASAAAPEKPRKRVLVVDDSVTVRAAERQLLVNEGYEVDVAVDGVDGWNCVRNASYDLVITDIDMPRMNGIELVRTIRQDVKLSFIPIIIVSYKDREEDRLQGLDAGANYYLTKSSFHDETLVGAVEDLLGGATS
jgi:two-component system sensor histidine kinase and response regulator WspE